MVAVAVPLNTIFGVVCALLLVRHKWKGNAVIDAIINLPFAISPVVIGLSLFLLYGDDGLVRPGARRSRDQDPLLDAGDDPRQHLRLAALRGARDGAGAAGDRHRAGAGRLDPRRQRLADLLADHPAGDPLGSRLRRSSSPPPACSASSAPSRSSPARSRARPRRCRSSSTSSSRTSTCRGPTGPRSCSPLLALTTLLAMNLLKRKEEA